MRGSIFLLFLCLLFPSCGREGRENGRITPEPPASLYKLQKKDFPQFSDDMDWASLRLALQRQIAWLEKREENAVGNTLFSYNRLLATAKALDKKLQENPTREEFFHYIENNFAIYQAAGRRRRGGDASREMLVTGYYEPVFAGALQQSARFAYPIYRLPKSLKSSAKNGAKEVWREEGGRRLPFWSRAEIENGAPLAGEELAWLADPFDAYLLHIQGSGKICLPDGTLRTIRFAGSNGLGYKSLGKLFVDKKIMPLEKVTVPAMRRWFLSHRQEIRPMLQHNPRFIFFSWGEEGGRSLVANPSCNPNPLSNPLGSTGIELVDGRSIAVDLSVFPAGGTAFLCSRKPVYGAKGRHCGWQPFCRFVLAQDSGSAIKGAGRVDIFWGEGEYAERAASVMKEAGVLYFLLAKTGK